MSWIPSHTFGWIINTQNSIQLTFWEIQICKSTIWTCSGSSIFSGVNDWNLKDFNFTITYLDDTIIFNRKAEEHLLHIKQVFEKLQAMKLSMKLSKCHFFSKEIQYLGHILSTKSICPITFEDTSHSKNAPPNNSQTTSYLSLASWIL